ncbi:MAG: hypothetical protein VXY11_04340 [Candidatus Thermoplasmatota archaeon]|nr:hypothetical protein [Candidatus Thermoplasmatota archaeon]
MNGRRRKDEPFNPFAPNAGQKARDRKEKVTRQPPRPKPSAQQKPTNDLAAKQKAAMEALKQRREIESKTASKPLQPQPVQKKHQPSPQPKPAPKTEVKRPDGREERLAALRAKSAATAQFAKEAKDAKKLDEKVEATINPVTALEPEVEVVIETKIDEPKKSSTSQGVANVFKTIKTEVSKSDRKQKRRRANDKKGGGRQPQSKKLDRRKYLEYKYAARELLENDAISEEHRSNILGQIWAKGERSGVDDAVEFINQKESELIIPEEVAEEFRKMVKRYTTKR